ncbi:MAG TPA: MarP family serine protease, partial [Gaiellaceae bacterium]|nr:MarP family serine protease [Gaiellaceae bacterium]
FAILFELLGSTAGAAVRRRLPEALRRVDSAGGLAFGVLAGLVLVWLMAAVALQLPGQQDLRREVQRSAVLRKLNDLVPPRSALRALARVDPFPSITGPVPPVGPPDPSVLRAAGVRRAAPSVVRVLGTACGLGVSGSGWVVSPGLVVTNAHVVAGERDTTIDSVNAPPLPAQAVAFDSKNDIAVLRVSGGLNAPPLEQAEPREGQSAAIMGFPENQPLTVRSGRLGPSVTVLSEDAYGHGPVTRRITSFRGDVRPGNSGGPLVDSSGRVVGTVFASRIQGTVGYAVPPDIVDDALADADGPVSTGDCVR